MRKVSLVITMLLGGLAGNAAADPMVWSVGAMNPTSVTGQFVDGFFTFDPATGLSTDWRIQLFPMTGGGWAPIPLNCDQCGISSSSIDPATHSVLYEPCIIAGSSCDSLGIFTFSSNSDNSVFSFGQSGHQSSFVLHLSLSQPLTNAGGTISLIPAVFSCTSDMPPVCTLISPGSYIEQTAPPNLFFPTSIAGSVSLVPEPGSVLNVLLGAAVLAAWRWRRFL